MGTCEGWGQFLVHLPCSFINLAVCDTGTLLEILGKLHWVNENWVYVGQLFPNFLLYAFTQHVSKDKCLHNGQPALGK